MGGETGVDTGIIADGITVGRASALDAAHKDFGEEWEWAADRQARWVFKVERGVEWDRECAQEADQEWERDSALEMAAEEWWVLHGS